MFSASPYIGVLVALIFIGVCVWLVIQQTKSLISQDKILFLLIMLTTLLTGVWVSDKIIAFRIQLLTPEESKEIFEIIRNMIATVLGYYFGTKGNDKKAE